MTKRYVYRAWRQRQSLTGGGVSGSEVTIGYFGSWKKAQNYVDHDPLCAARKKEGWSFHITKESVL